MTSLGFRFGPLAYDLKNLPAESVRALVGFKITPLPAEPGPPPVTLGKPSPVEDARLLGCVLIHPSISDAEKRKALNAREELFPNVESLADILRDNPDALGRLSTVLRNGFDIGYYAHNHDRTEQIRRKLDKARAEHARKPGEVRSEQIDEVIVYYVKHLWEEHPNIPKSAGNKTTHPIFDAVNHNLVNRGLRKKPLGVRALEQRISKLQKSGRLPR
jgi:hypothetical protein